MVLYKPDCNSNDYKLPNEESHNLNLSYIEVWLVRLACGIEYHTTLVIVKLCLAGCWQVDSWLEESTRLILDN